MAKNKLVPLTHTQIHHIYHKLGESKNARKIKAKLRIAMNTTCVKTGNTMPDIKIGDKVGLWVEYPCQLCATDFYISRTSERYIKSEDDLTCPECLRQKELDDKDAQIKKLADMLGKTYHSVRMAYKQGMLDDGLNWTEYNELLAEITESADGK